MLSSFKKHPRRNRFELKLRKTKIKFYSWWNKFYYGGGPNDDPTMLTRRPRHIPFISLRNDEYSEFLKIEENRTQQKLLKTTFPFYSVCVNSFDHNKAINQVLQNKYYISRRFKSRKPISKELGFSIYQDSFKNKQRSENNLKLSIVDTPGNIDDSTLNSFEQDLMSFALENNRDKLLPFGKPAKNRSDNNCSNEKEGDENFNYSFKNSGTYHHEIDHVINGNYIMEARDDENKENNTDSFSKLVVNVDKNANENNGNIYDDKNAFHNWVDNKLLIRQNCENKSDQIKNVDNSENLNKPARIPMIQRPEFFERELNSEDSNYSLLVQLNSEELKAQNYFEANQLNKQRKKPKISNKSSRMKLEILKGNTRERISSLISSLPSFRSTWVANKNIKELYPDLHHNIIDDLSLSAAKIATQKIYESSMSRNNYNKSKVDMSSFNFEDRVLFGGIRFGEEILTAKQANKLTAKTDAKHMINQTKNKKKITARKAQGRKISDSNYSLRLDGRVAVNLPAENQFNYAEKTSRSEFDIIASYQQLSG